MPRYSRLNYLLKHAPTSDMAKKFRDYRFSVGTDEYHTVNGAERVDQPNKKGFQTCTLTPFDTNLSASPLESVVVKMTIRAKEAYAAAGVSDAELNIDSTGTPGAGAIRRSGYRPAQVIISIPHTPAGLASQSQPPADAFDSGAAGTEDTDITPRSRVTGYTYNRIISNSYTFPFGASNVDGQRTQSEMAGRLAATLAVDKKTVRFVPERPIGRR